MDDFENSICSRWYSHYCYNYIKNFLSFKIALFLFRAQIDLFFLFIFLLVFCILLALFIFFSLQLLFAA